MDSNPSPRPAPPADFWKHKLGAFLHDPPSKALDIANHQKIAEPAYSAAGLEPNKYDKPADWTASSADRLPFPSRQISCKFDGQAVTFRHPLSGEPILLPEMTAAAALEKAATVQPVLTKLPPDWSEAETERAQFFSHWRNWREKTVERDWRLGFFPADTRIPDHTIWHHMSVVSAFAGCTGETGAIRPAFLKLQIGPVQDFIAASKSVRDLWSGSYLLSWLMAAGLKALSAEAGPDSVIFPSLFQQPMFDLHWKDELWSKVSVGGKNVWDSWGYTHKELLVPNLPNVFLALVPADRAAELGGIVEAAIRAEWEAISEASWNFCDAAVHEGIPLTGEEPDGLTRAAREQRFQKQSKHFLQISWSAEAWPENLREALELAAKFPAEMPIGKAAEGVHAVIDMATKHMPLEHRDGRYYTDKTTKDTLNNPGVAWAAVLQFTNWKLDAVRQTRSFAAWAEGGWESGASQNKDALNGREEAVAGGREWQKRCKNLGGVWPALFKKDDWVGASTLIKRVWHLAYLADKKKLRTSSAHFPMPDTRKVAMGKPDADEDEGEADKDSSEKYFAVLALDGDEIGKWVSGEKSRTFAELLAPPAADYFRAGHFKEFLQTRRPLSPGFHLQFSETLSNFARRVVPGIVDFFDGRLIYAGGDDVLAMLPADKAFPCALALRSAFQGKDPGVPGISSPAPGFLCSDAFRQENGAEFRNNEERIPFPVPGPNADVSVGIAMAHFKHPLQDVVRAAQAAEKRAKTKHNRGAVSISTFKRSGEILEWGCKWDGGGIALFKAIAGALTAGKDDENIGVSGKFPYRVCELLTPYLSQTTGLGGATSHASFPAEEIIKKEVEFAALQQGSKKVAGEIAPLLEGYLHGLPNEDKDRAQIKTDPVGAVIGLCRSVAFAHRTRSAE